MSNVNLFQHQQQVLKETEYQNRVAYYLDMGLGKTFVGAEKMIRLGASVSLVVCQKSKIQDWIDHFKNYYPEYQTLNLTTKSKQTFTDKVRKIRNEIGLIDLLLNGDKCKCIGVINYDLLFRRSELLKLRDFTLMLDESSLIQNETAKRSKFILKMNPSNVILLSGTPTSGKYENLWTQIHLLGWNISQDTYNKQYINWKLIEDDIGFKHKIVDKDGPYKNVDRLKSKMREHGAVFMKTEECFELPEQNFITVNVPASKEYRKFKKDCIIEVDGTELVGDTIFSKRLYLRMLCGHYNKNKLQAFEDLVSSTKDRLIVFYNFDAELERLKKIAEVLERPVSEVNGNCKDMTAYENEDDSITFIQYKAGAKGLNLQRANKMVYFTLTESCEDWMQSQKRIHRIGQERKCFYYVMVCKNSIEEDIQVALQSGVDYTDDLFRKGEVI